MAWSDDRRWLVLVVCGAAAVLVLGRARGVWGATAWGWGAPYLLFGVLVAFGGLVTALWQPGGDEPPSQERP